jgi:hypothetical protein
MFTFVWEFGVVDVGEFGEFGEFGEVGEVGEVGELGCDPDDVEFENCCRRDSGKFRITAK